LLLLFLSNANLTAANILNCDADTKQRVGIQIWVIAAGAVGVVGDVPTQVARGGDDAIRLNSLNNLTYTRTVTCVYVLSVFFLALIVVVRFKF
jgi:hypothetical protein